MELKANEIKLPKEMAFKFSTVEFYDEQAAKYKMRNLNEITSLIMKTSEENPDFTMNAKEIALLYWAAFRTKDKTVTYQKTLDILDDAYDEYGKLFIDSHILAVYCKSRLFQAQVEYAEKLNKEADEAPLEDQSKSNS